MRYEDFVATKAVAVPRRGMRDIPAMNPAMFGFQSDALGFLLGIGSGAALLDTGLGKSIIELEFARIVHEHTNRPVLMLAPLAVSQQHKREAEKFGETVTLCRDQSDVVKGVNITNYERLHLFDRSQFAGLVLDESSIIKSFTGKTTRALMEFAGAMDWRLAATATPAPNDHMELGQHSQFLGVMQSNEMLARWFIADQSEMGRYRLKRYGVRPFWSWVASWARMLSKPSDLGYSDDGFDLPKLTEHLHYVDADISQDTGGALFRSPTTSATEIHKEKRITAPSRAQGVADLIESDTSGQPWVVWCDTDYEADELTARIPGAIEVRGSMPADTKEARLADFSLGNIRILVTKPSIAGFGLNWQHCNQTAFVGLSFSYEMYYQAIRRFWRFGQQRPVDVHVFMAETEEAMWRAVQRKKKDHEAMKREMFEAMKRETITKGVKNPYQATTKAKMPSWLRSAR